MDKGTVKYTVSTIGNNRVWDSGIRDGGGGGYQSQKIHPKFSNPVVVHVSILYIKVECVSITVITQEHGIRFPDVRKLDGLRRGIRTIRNADLSSESPKYVDC